MSRTKFKRGKQKEFFDSVRKRSSLSWSELARECSLHPRTLYDWRREKYYADYETVRSLGKRYNIPLTHCKQVDTYWHIPRAAVMGGRARYKQYGLLGTVEDRRKGGLVSQAHRRDDPEKYRSLGCNVRKVFKKPIYTKELAEVVGIILGDGSINNYQVRITLDRTTDRKYASFVSGLMQEVFSEKPTWSERESVIELTLSGVALVKMLETMGLKRGNKVVNQVNIPSWIFGKGDFQKACLRGLFDTDGSIYEHVKPQGVYIGWTFTNYSNPIIVGVSTILSRHALKHSLQGAKSVYIYKLDTIVEYMDRIGSHNPKHTQKVEKYKKYKTEGCTEW